MRIFGDIQCYELKNSVNLYDLSFGPSDPIWSKFVFFTTVHILENYIFNQSYRFISVTATYIILNC